MKIEKLNDERFQNGFASKFAMTLIPKLEEFQTELEKAVKDKDLTTIQNLVHTIVVSLRFLELDSFESTLYEYKDLPWHDSEACNTYVKKVSANSQELLKALASYL